MATVFLSSFSAREPKHRLVWLDALRAAGLEVTDPEDLGWAPSDYGRILPAIRGADLMVALAEPCGSTRAAVEWTSGALGRDTHDGALGSWKPIPTLFWIPPEAPREAAEVEPVARWLLENCPGVAERLPDELDAAVARVVEAAAAVPRPGGLRPPGSNSP